MEFDIFDKVEKVFLSTKRRMELLKNLPVVSVKVLANGRFSKESDILNYLTTSNFISEKHLDNLCETCDSLSIDKERCLKETDNSRLMEGLYIKVEDDGVVVDRLKYVRYSFLQTVVESKTHWLDRPIVPNKLDRDINDLF